MCDLSKRREEEGEREKVLLTRFNFQSVNKEKRNENAKWTKTHGNRQNKKGKGKSQEKG